MTTRDGSRSLRRQTRLRSTRVWFLAPAAILLGGLALFPLLQLLRMSVSDVTVSTLLGTWDFVGLANFAAGIHSGETGEALVRTIVFVVIVSIVGLGGGLAAALALRTRSWASGMLLALMVFVWALPPVVNGSVWKFLLGDAGLFNIIARATGLTQSAIPFLYDQNLALVSVAFVNSWAVIPFNALVFRAALMAIPAELLEAASIDGARPWQTTAYVLIPGVRATTLVLAVLTVVYAFRSFDFIYVMTRGGPGTATVTLPFLGYLQAFVQFDFGLGAATSVIAAALVLVLAVVYARSVRKEEKS